ncbi:hypothetical protein ACJX0J_023511, partial [Zea mays]
PTLLDTLEDRGKGNVMHGRRSTIRVSFVLLFGRENHSLLRCPACLIKCISIHMPFLSIQNFKILKKLYNEVQGSSWWYFLFIQIMLLLLLCHFNRYLDQCNVAPYNFIGHLLGPRVFSFIASDYYILKMLAQLHLHYVHNNNIYLLHWGTLHIIIKCYLVYLHNMASVLNTHTTL